MSKPLSTEWSFYVYFKNQMQNKYDKYDNYAEDIEFLGSFNTIEGFWNIYSHLRRPNDLIGHTDYHLFRNNIKGIWEHDDNVNGGKWMIKLKKGFCSYYWERLILSLIGGQFPLDVVGAIVSFRNNEDIIHLWNKTADNQDLIHEIRKILSVCLNLPPDTKLEYKKHQSSREDNSSFRNTTTYSAEIEESFENNLKKKN